MIDPIYLVTPPRSTEVMHCEKHGDVPFYVTLNLDAHCSKCYDEQMREVLAKMKKIASEKQLKIITAGSLRDYSMGVRGEPEAKQEG